jgi:hypothetical protein
MCRLTFDALVAGHKPIEVPVEARPALQTALQQNTPQAYWDGAVRQLLRTDPEVLT